MKPRTYVLTVLALLVGISKAAHAQGDLCLPEAYGVPYTGGAGPDWWTCDPAYSCGTAGLAFPLDDPGWVGATQTGHGNSAPILFVRGIKDATTDIYLAFHSQIPLDATFPQAQLWLGFDDKTNTRVLRVRVRHSILGPFNADKLECYDSTGTAPCTNNKNNSFEILAAASGSDPVFDQSLTRSTSWPNDFGRVWTKTSGSSKGTSIFLRVPISALGLTSSSGSFSFWYEFDLIDSGGTIQNPVAKWPAAAGIQVVNNEATTPTLSAPPVSQWGTLRLGDSASTCRKGIFVNWSNVGIAHGAATGALTNQIVGQEAGADVDNFFVAQPEDSSGAPLPSAGLEARFRIADWGSTPSASAAWTSVHQRINDAGGSASEWVTLSGNRFVQGPWTLTSDQRCDYSTPVSGTDTCASPATHRAHQCVLTELRASGVGLDAGAPVQIPILRDSVYKNTNFVNLSRFERVATIDAQDRTKSGDVDYYLYVDTRNMPGHYDSPTDPKAEVVDRLKGVANRIKGRYAPPANVAKPLEQRANNGDHGAAAQLEQLRENARSKMPEKTKARLAAVNAAIQASDPLAAVATLDTETLEEVMPSMIVYVFRDSGKHIEQDGKTVTILESLPAFGYYARHNGKIAGWRAVLDGAHRLGNSNWYRLTVPGGGARKINTRMQARAKGEAQIEPDPEWPRGHGEVCPKGQTCREAPRPCPSKISWWIFLVLGLILVAAFALGMELQRRRGM